jgi:hypothetical protein
MDKTGREKKTPWLSSHARSGEAPWTQQTPWLSFLEATERMDDIRGRTPPVEAVIEHITPWCTNLVINVDVHLSGWGMIWRF